MTQDVTLPQWGMGTNEAYIVEWLKSVGETIAEGEGLVEVETAKATDIVASTAAGTIVELLFDVGDEVPVGDVIARVRAAVE
ncbi:biotin/lipoyl-containing protein [Microbacterium sp. A196]|uniref:biotin/lipoyl-containing protein n=1 Tax=Microbacterium sp. A196 TaxID=3457320 RepID=UPI003FD56F12